MHFHFIFYHHPFLQIMLSITSFVEKNMDMNTFTPLKVSEDVLMCQINIYGVLLCVVCTFVGYSLLSLMESSSLKVWRIQDLQLSLSLVGSRTILPDLPHSFPTLLCYCVYVCTCVCVYVCTCVCMHMHMCILQLIYEHPLEPDYSNNSPRNK